MHKNNWTKSLVDCVVSFAKLTDAVNIHYCNGSEEEAKSIYNLLISSGAIKALNKDKRPNSYLALSDPADVARMEDRTFICSKNEIDSGASNNWCDPILMKDRLNKLYKGCMKGRTLYAIPFYMGKPGGACIYGIELTDSPYVVVNMRIMTQMGDVALQHITEHTTIVKCYHSVGCPLAENEITKPWPCNIKDCVIAHFPEDLEICSYGSGYGGNSLLCKKCLALRIASYIGKKEGWLAEHMLLLCLEAPDGKKYHVAAAFPSACGKTNLSMSEIPKSINGYKLTTIGDDIAWITPGKDGKLYAINPENGFFGVATGTSYRTNKGAMETIQSDTIFTNVGYTKDGDVWWDGIGYDAPEDTLNWLGMEAVAGEKISHPNARFTAPIKNCPKVSDSFDATEGVPLDIILFGGRRTNTIPLITKSMSWSEGVFMAATMSSETTHAATIKSGILRRDPFSMLPFCGYNIVDYFNHWLSFEDKNLDLPSIYYVNWFRKDADNKFIWPGFSENIRVIIWALEAHKNKNNKQNSVLGTIPNFDDINMEDLDISKDKFEEIITIDKDAYKAEVLESEEYLHSLGKEIPKKFISVIKRLKAELNK